MLIALGLFARLRSKANNTRTAAPTSKQYTEGNFPLRCLFTRQEPLSLPTPLSLLRSLSPPLSLSLLHQNFSLAARSLRHRPQLHCLHFPDPLSRGLFFHKKDTALSLSFKMYADSTGYQRPRHGHSASYGGGYVASSIPLTLLAYLADTRSGPPPAKKVRGNPIITRYPPPPGYVPPVQQLPTPPYGQSPLWPGQSYTQPTYLPNQQTGYSTPQTYAQAPPSHLPGYHDYAPHVAWQAPAQAMVPDRRYSVPTIPNSDLDGNGDLLSPQDLNVNDNALEHEFDEECYYARHPEQIIASLSLGIIEHKAPLPSRSALPCTFREAELEALAPRAVSAPHREGVSALCVDEEALLSVRQTDAWHDLKSSIIFKEFPKTCNKLISISDLLARYKEQFDAEWAAGPRSPTPALTRASTPARPESRASSHSHIMEHDQHEGSVRRSTERPEEFGGQFNALDDFDAVMSRANRRYASVGRSRAGSMARSRAGSVAHCRAGSINQVRAGSITHSRAGSVAHSRAGSVTHTRHGSVQPHSRRQSSTTNSVRPKMLPAIHDPVQDDILAALGVSGSPKTVYQTPGPAFGPPPTSVVTRHSRESSVSSVHSNHHHIQQPSIAEGSEALGAIKHRVTHVHGANTLQPHDEDREPDEDATPRPQRWQRDSTRKRSYADSQAGAQQSDDDTPKRPKPCQPNHR